MKSWQSLITGVFILILSLHSCKEDVEPMSIIQTIAKLPEAIRESSGIVQWNGSLWTHNDSGDEAILYELSTVDGSLVRSIKIKNADHKDWEDLAQDQDYLYIGDFGNNNGNRTDLSIYRLAKNQMQEDTVKADKISFYYPDQTDFSSRPKDHNFDCEAMIATANQLVLFSKNHRNLQTKVYLLPKLPGNYEAELQSTFAANGLVTGAELDDNNQILSLLLYRQVSDFQPFTLFFSDYPNNDFFEGKEYKIELDINKKTEGIALKGNHQYFITSEGRSKGEETIYLLDVAESLK